MSEQENKHSLSPVLTGLLCRCPHCGKGRLFRGLLSVAERCEACGFDLKKADPGDGPAVFIIFILGFIVVPLAIWTEFTFEPPLWLHALIWPVVILGGSIALLRPLKGLMVALQHHHKASDTGSVDYD